MSKILYIGKIIKWVIILFFSSSILVTVLLKFMPVWFTPLMFTRCFEQISEGKELTLHHRWISIDKMPEDMPRAVMASEDARFLQHHGFDFESMLQAAKHNQNSKRIHGASTISQQTAKNVFLWQSRSYVRKALEAYFTALIEFIWGKERIMEVYLNSVEMGDGIYGVAAVAEYHFNKSPLELTRSDCALIAVTLPNPRKFSSKEPSAYIRKRQQRIKNDIRFVKWDFNKQKNNDKEDGE